MDWSVLLVIVPVVVLFLYGIERFSEEVRHAAGERFWTSSRMLPAHLLRGAVAGAGVWAITHSNTSTTFMAAGHVDVPETPCLGR